MPKIKTDQIKELNALKQLLHYNNFCLTHTKPSHTRPDWDGLLFFQRSQHDITPLKKLKRFQASPPASRLKTQGIHLHLFLWAFLAGPACACREIPAK